MASPYETVILNLLFREGELFGLELIAKSNGFLKRGTVYVLLDRLENEGLVKSKLKDAPKGSKGPARRLYRITGSGETALRESLAKRSQIDGLLGLNGGAI